jgi:hypothetical protein
MLSYDGLSKNAPLFAFKIRKGVSKREIILALFTAASEVSPVFGKISLRS